jgi:hypothetical protein
MRTWWILAPAAVSLLIVGSWTAGAQAPSATDCETLRGRLAEHAKVSDGVRKMLAGLPAPAAVAAPAAPAAPAPAAPAAGRADAIRARLKQIPDQRQQLEEQRLGALMKLDWSRASTIQGQMTALDKEKVDLEKELAALPATPAAAQAPAASPATAPPAAVAPAERVACKDMPAAYDSALKIRRKEMGAREDNAGVVPLVALRGQTAEQIAQELAAQFAPWPDGGMQVGLLDQDGDGKLDAFADMPARDSYRLHRQRADGSLIVEAFVPAGKSGEYGDSARRLDEAVARYAGWGVMDALAARPVGAVRVLGEAGEFAKAWSHVLAGRFVEAGQVDGGAAARTREFENFRGERMRMLEVVAPVTSGVSIRRVLVAPRPGSQEQWDEVSVAARVPSYWRTEVDMTGSRELRTTAGAPVGTRTALAPGKVSLER